MTPALSIVRHEPETIAARIRTLQAEVQALSLEQMKAMRANILAGIEVASEVAANPAQPEGVRGLAEKIARDGEALLGSLDGVAARASR